MQNANNQIETVQKIMTHYLSPETRAWIAIALIVLMFVSVIGVLILVALYRKVEDKKERRVRFRRRSIQFLSVGLAIPAILVLALDGVLAPEALATLLGTFFGYVLSGIGDEEKE
jgi:ABC-type proline/glycine betaine transport system permease subunit